MSTRNHHVCCVVPPYLLNAIADSSHNEDHIRECARNALTVHKDYIGKREKRFAALCAPRGSKAAAGLSRQHSIVPDHMLKHIAESEDVDDDTRACARRDLEHIKKVHTKYQESQGLRAESSDQKALTAAQQPSRDTEKTYRAVYNANHDSNEAHLPGKVVRVEGQKASNDESANEAYDNAGLVLSFYKDIFNWKSIDNHNQQVISSVHFGINYENAFWDPEVAQMVYGDGHTFLTNFTGAVDVIGHELTHAVTEHTSPLDYTGQSGALNEHVSDVFGIMIKQRVEDETADKADWLIGEYCLMPGVKGVALRSMKEPGTAYDDPRFGKDPQPGNFKDYKVTVDDNGGVHLYSGIPNKAFYLASVAFGGYSWEKAGKIWWETMNSGQIPARCTFVQFADVTVDKAEELFGDDAAAIVRKAWKDVGVVRKSHA
ncbi:Metalloprotease [Annulohypoxylon maeteangense]|uniref:Metalloprotease n=1 Tax=Annulohypoxylon maeteangense TaxID=1927788 RepID=UPI0020088C77|nr:Metalloprotease [Annulohypoxylon maeteangense]KAI0887764.1 Metalloprotease [Annulohypoxylon maeteangense]